MRINSRATGRFLGLVLSVVILGAGLYGTIAIINTINATAEPVSLWLALGGCMIAAAIGVFALIMWADTDMKRQERQDQWQH